MHKTVRYEAREFPRLAGLPDFSTESIEQHLGLYEGYVKRVNSLLEALGDENGQATLELRRRLGWEFNGMRLHELFFEQLRDDPPTLPDSPKCHDLIEEGFGNPREWQEDLRTLAEMPGVGWAATVRDRASGNVANIWIDEHATGLPADCDILILVDLFEHAFIRDFGTDKKAYLDAIFRSIDWDVVSDRVDRVVGAPATGGQSTEEPLVHQT